MPLTQQRETSRRCLIDQQTKKQLNYTAAHLHSLETLKLHRLSLGSERRPTIRAFLPLSSQEALLHPFPHCPPPCPPPHIQRIHRHLRGKFLCSSQTLVPRSWNQSPALLQAILGTSFFRCSSSASKSDM